MQELDPNLIAGVRNRSGDEVMHHLDLMARATAGRGFDPQIYSLMIGILDGMLANFIPNNSEVSADTTISWPEGCLTQDVKIHFKDSVNSDGGVDLYVQVLPSHGENGYMMQWPYSTDWHLVEARFAAPEGAPPEDREIRGIKIIMAILAFMFAIPGLAVAIRGLNPPLTTWPLSFMLASFGVVSISLAYRYARANFDVFVWSLAALLPIISGLRVSSEGNTRQAFYTAIAFGVATILGWLLIRVPRLRSGWLFWWLFAAAYCAEMLLGLMR